MSSSNLDVYNRPDVAAHYAVLNYLTPCEQKLFSDYIKPGSKILDLGVGGGRTTPYLAAKSSRYVGVDYASEMIQICRQKHPDLEFRVAEASQLSCFDNASFDAVVCAFNGMDYVIPDEARVNAWRECFRVLAADGILLFSSHNPRSILIRSGWNRERIRGLAARVGEPGHLLGESAFLALSVAARSRAACRSAWATANRIVRRMPRRAFWRGEGYLLDPAHGGLMTHCWIPERVMAELAQHGFRCLTVLGNDYPAVSRAYGTDWYYYVFSKMSHLGSNYACAS